MTDNYPAKELVDIHCHIIPGVDDGSDGFESTMKMLKTAQDEGITRMKAYREVRMQYRCCKT